MSYPVTVRYWAGARRAAGLKSERLTAGTLADICRQLSERPELAAIIAASSLLVDGVAGHPDTTLYADAVVDVLPPFSGG